MIAKNKFVLLSGIPLLGCLIYTGLCQIVANDIFWHLKTGQDFLFHGINPFIDHYSIDFQGTWIRGLPVFFDILVATFYELFGGLRGIQIFRVVLWVVPFFCILYLSIKKRWHWTHVVFALTLYVAAITHRRLVRPELLNYCLIIIYSYILMNKEKPKKYLYWLLGLQIFWVNHHMSAAIGYVLLFGIYFEYLKNWYFSKKEKKRLLFLFAMGLTTLAAGFLNPSFYHPLMEALSLDSRWSLWIIELVPPKFSKLSLLRQYFWFLVGILSLGLFFFRFFGAFTVLGVFAFYAWGMGKLFPPMAVLVCILSLFLLSEIKNHLQGKTIYLKGLFYIFLLITTSFHIEGIAQEVFYSPLKIGTKITAQTHPVDIIDHLKSKKPHGSIINSYNIGGYLIYHLGPDLKVYVDGRTNILYPVDFFARYMDMDCHVGLFGDLAKKYQFDYVAGRLYEPNRIADTAMESGLYGIDYVGSRNVVLVPIKKSPYPKSSHYFRFPQCLNKAALKTLDEEIQLAQKTMSKVSQFHMLFQNAIIYNQAKDKRAFLKSFIAGDAPIVPNITLRYLAYRALNLKEPILAAQLMQKAKNGLTRRDSILLVDILCKFYKCKGAPFYFLRNVDKNMPNWERKKLLAQYKMLKEKFGEKIYSPRAQEQIDERLMFKDEPWKITPQLNPCKRYGDTF